MRRTDPFETYSAVRITKLLINLGLIDDGERVCISRLYPGHHQRSVGAWSWEAQSELRANTRGIGSQWPVRDILSAEKVSIYTDPWGDVALYPE